MNKKTNRVLSLVLALVLIVGTLPVGVLASSDINGKDETILTEEVKTKDKTEETKETEKEQG